MARILGGSIRIVPTSSALFSRRPLRIRLAGKQLELGDESRRESFQVVGQVQLQVADGVDHGPDRHLGYWRTLAARRYRGREVRKVKVEIRYDQPIITVAGREMVYYVPLLPGYELYKARMGLREESYLITFESVGGSSLSLRTPVSHFMKDSPRQISVYPVNFEVIGVERMPNRTPEATPGQRQRAQQGESAG